MFSSGHKIASQLFPSIVWAKDTGTPDVYFTFDDGPHPEFTPQILNILKSYNLKATFFLIGENVLKYPQIVSQIYEQGHTVGLHSYSHKNLIFKSRKQLLYELLQPQKIIKNIIGFRPPLFRPPFGKFTPRLIKLCREVKLTMVMWTIMSYDFNLKIPDNRIINRMLKHLQNGAIIVFHDGNKNSARTIKILPCIIKFVLQKGNLPKKL